MLGQLLKNNTIHNSHLTEESEIADVWDSKYCVSQLFLDIRLFRFQPCITMVATWWTQFKTMIWKTVLLKRRNKSKTFAEFFLPVMYVAILAVIKRTAQLNPLEPFGGFPEYSIFNGSILSSSFPDNHPLRILVTPNNSQVRDIMSEFSKIFTDITKKNVSVEIFLNDTIAEEEFQANGSSVLAGIVFNFNGKGSLSYALRFPTSSLPSVQYSDLFASQSSCRKKIGDTQVNDDGLQHNDNCQVNKYMFTGFVQLQATIDAALMKVLYGISYLSNEVAVQMLPKPAFQTDTNYIQVISSMYFVLAYLPLISYFTVALVAEKEKKITEGMKMMGLKSSVFWTSTFCVYMFTAIVITGIVTIIAVVADFLPNSSYGLFFILLVFYGISMISLACMLAPFFNKAMMAGVAASMGTMIVSCLYLAVSLTRTYEEGTGSVSYKIPVYGRWLLCLLSPVCLALGMDQAIYMDITGGLNLTSARKGDFPFIGPLFMLLVDSMIYFLLAVYFDNVIPGEYGPKYHPLYIFSPSYWCPPKQRGLFVTFNNDAVEYGGEHPGESTSADIEPVPENMKEKAAVRISGLTKMYKSTDKKKGEVKAINNLSLTIYEDQITAILGHNGAGKTTLMNILTGMTGATSGSATIKGLDVTRTSDIETLRSMTGVCPQHNILFDQFTCYEHLRLFAGLKGGNISEAEIDEALAVVDLKEQRDVLSTKLSGGQKRKLSVAIAIIGDPKIIFLDEPTAGMDPFSRRSLWEVLKNKKKGRIILLTTHFMDEADILSDRKAIINKGSLRCCGSSFYLKNKFGIGYHLNMVVEPDCDTDKVSYMVQEVVEGSEVNRVHGRELDITLPQAGVNKFAELFSKLEHPATAKELGVKNFGVSMTTLEEVFLKLEEDVNDLELEETAGDIDTSTLLPPVVQIQKYGSATHVDMTSRSNPSDTVDCVMGKTLAWQRFRGMFTVVAKTHLRSPLANIFHIVLPVAFVIVGIVLSKNLKTSFGQGPSSFRHYP
ncbi:hypothetical protein DPMN_170353 [Dreissena polymorpha]|uniref:ABC transporter domain-containing protein n=1 Tax=Dreissena polymorpha TaxID=45954 RepID=A0A9D4DY77_DREPO|nr:hypothetical protein DPMN_170353 [Dreissena polymorpha]